MTDAAKANSSDSSSTSANSTECLSYYLRVASRSQSFTIPDNGMDELSLEDELDKLCALHPRDRLAIQEQAIRFACALSTNSHVEELELSCKLDIGDVGITHIAHALRHHASLRRIHLARMRIGVKGARELALAIKHNPRLVDVTLSSNNLGDEGAAVMGWAILNHTSIQKLRITCNKVGVEGARQLGIALRSSHKNNMALEELDLSRNKLGDAGARLIARALFEQQQNTTTQEVTRSTPSNYLKKLVLSSNSISSKGAEEFGIALTRNTHLEELDLGCNRLIGDVGATHLANALRQNSSLRKLRLHFCLIEAKGAKELAAALLPSSATSSDRSRLEELDLKSNLLGDDGATHMAEVIRENCASSSPLKSMNLSGNSISKQGTIELLEALTVNRAMTNLSMGRTDNQMHFYLMLCRNKARQAIEKDAKACSYLLCASNPCPSVMMGLLMDTNWFLNGNDEKSS